MGTILLYGYEDLPSILAIGAAAGPFQAEVLPVHAGDYLKPIGALVGRDVPGRAKPYTGGILGNKLMVFCDLDEALNDLMAALREAGVTPEVYKAVLTDHNQGWDVLTLMGELKRERESFQKKT